MKKFIYILALLIFGSGFAQDDVTLFNKATQDYANQNYEAALKKYKTILGHNKVSAALYYNMGNAFYKLNDVGPSIYYYEKALLLKPNDEDIKNNLAFAKNMTIDAIEDLPKTGLSKIVDNLISKLSYNGWAMLAILGAVLFAVFFLSYYFSASTRKKRVFFAVSSIFFILALASVIFAYVQLSIQQSKKFAIVFAEETSVKAEPNSRSNQVFLLHEGTKVKVLDSFSGYTKIELTDGRQGWITQNDIKQL